MELTHTTFGSSNPGRQEQQAEEKVPMTKNDLYQLLELGRIEDELQIGEVVFRLRTLSAFEVSKITKEFGDSVAELKNTEDEATFVTDNSKYLELSSTILSYAIVSVNNMPLEQVVEVKAGESVIELKKDIIKNFQWPVIYKLMDFYNKMVVRSESEFGEELKK